jgi:hypothetical protein
MPNKTNEERGLYTITQDILPLILELSKNNGEIDISGLSKQERLKLSRLCNRTGVMEYKPSIIRTKEFRIIDADFKHPKIQVI